MSEVRWVMVDIETNGLNPHYHQPIEVGLVSHDNLQASFSLGFDVRTSSPEALEINGWGQREFAPPMTDYDAIKLVMKWFENGEYIVAAPAHFDVGFLEAWMRRLGYDPPWGHRRVIDVKSFAQGRWGALASLSNSMMGKLVSLEDSANKHSALDDAIWQAEMFRRILR